MASTRQNRVVRSASAVPSVALIAQCFPPETHAGANRMAALAKALGRRSALRVVTVQPSYPHPEAYQGRNPEREDEAFPFQVIRTRPFHPHRGSYAWRAVRERRMAAELVEVAERLHPEMVWATSPSIFVGIAASRLAKRRGLPFIWDLRDVTWDYVADTSSGGMEGMARKAGAAVLRRRMAANLKETEQVVVSNPGIARAVVELGVSNERVTMAPNGVSADVLEHAAGVSAVPTSHKPRLTYAGAIGYYQALDLLLDVAERMPEIEVCIAGDGPVRPALEADARARGLNNVVFAGYVGRERLFRIYESSDVLFAGLRDSPSMAAATFPSKPFEYMAVGRPVVYAGRGIAAESLEATGAVLLAEPESAESVAGAVDRLLGDPDLWGRLARRGRVEAPRHRREDIMKAAVDSVLDAIGQSGTRAPTRRGSPSLEL